MNILFIIVALIASFLCFMFIGGNPATLFHFSPFLHIAVVPLLLVSIAHGFKGLCRMLKGITLFHIKRVTYNEKTISTLIYSIYSVAILSSIFELLVGLGSDNVMYRGPDENGEFTSTPIGVEFYIKACLVPFALATFYAEFIIRPVFHGSGEENKS
mgnify:CR=1 FL=1